MKTYRIEVRDRTIIVLAALLIVLASFVAGATVAGTASRWVSNQLVFDGVSGNDAEKYDVNGLRFHPGSGTDDTIESNGTYLKVGPTVNGYVASGTPFNVASVYVNNLVQALTYGGGTLPARAFTVTDIAYSIRAGGALGVDGGITDNNAFQISDGTNKCGCTFACDQDAGPHIALCVNDAGVGCVYPASSSLIYGFSAVGSCTAATDILGNIDVRGKWQ
jgi:hypothetical protein